MYDIVCVMYNIVYDICKNYDIVGNLTVLATLTRTYDIVYDIVYNIVYDIVRQTYDIVYNICKT